MTKQEALKWIHDAAGREGLEQEVLWIFDDNCESRDQKDNYYLAAYDALYEWDCL
jgi:hypothetical protein